MSARRAPMAEPTLRRLSRMGLALAFGGYVGAIVLSLASNAGSIGGSGAGPSLADAVFVVVSLTFPAVGFVILRKQPRNTIGWILIAIGVVWGLSGVVDSYAQYGIAHPGSVPFPTWVEAANSSAWVPGIGLIGTFLILLFPDGHLPSPRWRPVAWLAAGAMAAAVLGVTLSPGDVEISRQPSFPNPFGHGVVGAIGRAFLIGIPLLPISIAFCAVALISRYRRSTGQERLQLKWLASAAGFCATLYAAGMAASLGRVWGTGKDPTWLGILQNVTITSLVLIPIAIGFAVLKYRLYDIDVVINKTVVYGALAAFITAVYVAIVVGIGAAIGQRSSSPNLGLSILATAVVAVAFGPVQQRVQRVANRLVYGARATPYEVLSSFSSRMGGRYAIEELLPKMAEALAKGTGAVRTEVWLNVADELRLEGAWPDEAQTAAGTLSGIEPPREDDRTRVARVSHDGQEMGFLVVRMGPGDPFNAADEKLVGDVAAQAGLVLRNVRLIEELRASRQRLVAARDEERRKLERNIHDGAQQRLVALAVRFNLARKLVGPDGNGAGETIERLGAQTQAALENLRDLARGIYPPLLADKGLAAALDAQARKAPMPATVLATGVGRYPQDVEAAVYFCCLEALQNVAKYAGASAAVVRLAGTEGELAFDVTDDGVGFDQGKTPLGSGLTNMTDRLDALGGSLEVRSRPGAGTTVSGRIPVAVREAVPA
jgi:signal transduction histidine kinase